MQYTNYSPSSQKHLSCLLPSPAITMISATSWQHRISHPTLFQEWSKVKCHPKYSMISGFEFPAMADAHFTEEWTDPYKDVCSRSLVPGAARAPTHPTQAQFLIENTPKPTKQMEHSKHHWQHLRMDRTEQGLKPDWQRHSAILFPLCVLWSHSVSPGSAKSTFFSAVCPKLPHPSLHALPAQRCSSRNAF